LISVDVPEPIGSENYIGPFSFLQLIRIIFYAFPIIILSIYISILLLIFLVVPVFLVWKKYDQNDFDIFLLKALSWKISPKRKERSDLLDSINLRTLSRNAMVWEYYEGYMCAIETSGVSIEFIDDNDKNNIYNQFCNFLNSIDFQFSIYIYSYKDSKRIKIDNENEFLKKVALEQENLIRYYNEKFLKKKFIIIIDLKYSENKFKLDINRASEILNERADLIINSLNNMNLKAERLKFYEYGDLYSLLW